MLAKVLFSVLLAVQYPVLAVAASLQLAAYSNNVCSSGIYGELAGVLKSYSAAQQYCSAKYYPPTFPTAQKLHGRGATTTTTTKPSLTSKPTTIHTDVQSSAWSKCQGQGSGVLSTMCACIVDPVKISLSISIGRSSTTTTPTTTTTTSTSTTSTTSTAPAASGLVACDPNAADGGPSGGCTNCSCDPDVSGNTAYCTGTLGSGIDCNSDSDCPTGEFCDSLLGGACANSVAGDGTQCVSTYTPNKRSIF